MKMNDEKTTVEIAAELAAIDEADIASWRKKNGHAEPEIINPDNEFYAAVYEKINEETC